MDTRRGGSGRGGRIAVQYVEAYRGIRRAEPFRQADADIRVTLVQVVHHVIIPGKGRVVARHRPLVLRLVEQVAQGRLHRRDGHGVAGIPSRHRFDAESREGGQRTHILVVITCRKGQGSHCGARCGFQKMYSHKAL